MDVISHFRGRSPHGERELKYLIGLVLVFDAGGRSPRGERELKYGREIIILHGAGSLPPRGA